VCNIKLNPTVARPASTLNRAWKRYKYLAGKDQSTTGGSLLGLGTLNFIHTTGVRRSRAKLLNPLRKVGFADPVENG